MRGRKSAYQWGAIVSLFSMLGILPRDAHAQTDDPCVGHGAFLTLPYDDSEGNIALTNGWLYTDDGTSHKGVDYYNNDVTFNVRAAANGRAVVTQSPTVEGAPYGNFVFIAHPEKDNTDRRYYTLYAHLANNTATVTYRPFADFTHDLDVDDYSEWTPVKRGDILGKAGNTGNESYHIHLHFELQCGGYAHGKTDPYDIYGGSPALYTGLCGPERNQLRAGWGECPPRPWSCSNLYTTGTPPVGYGASYNTLSTDSLKGELILEATSCRAPGVMVTAGSDQQVNPIQYIYHTGYQWTGTQWQPFELEGDQPVSTWFLGHASKVLPIAMAPDTPKYVVAYMCTFIENQWKCGCRDTACATPSWQLQGFTLK